MNVHDLWKIRGKKYVIAVPSDDKTECDWYLMPKTVYEHRTYPICPACNLRYVPIKDYKKCFKCQLKTT